MSMLVSALDTSEAAMARESRPPLECGKVVVGIKLGVSFCDSGANDVVGAIVCVPMVWA